jgi:formiminotetrahydrofolate cyclodeaminase
MALPKSNDVEKAARRAAIEQALVRAAEVPLDMIDAVTSALGCLQHTAELGTSHALGDVMTGGFLLQATALGSLENVEANAASMKVPENRERFETAARIAREQLGAEMTAVQVAVAARQS